MNNKEVAALLDEIARLLELKGENPFKIRSYSTGARHIEQADDNVATLVAEGRLKEIDGIGDALSQKITELVQTGTLAYYEELRASFPPSLFELFLVPGLGPKRIRTLHEELGITSLGELEYACTENRLVSLKGFGLKFQDKLLDGIAFAEKSRGLFLFDLAESEATRLYNLLGECPAADRVAVAGSVRRHKEIIKDIDLVVSSDNPDAVMECFVSSPGVQNVTSHGSTKSSVVLESGIAADLRVVPDEAFPYALHHFTGSREHNVAMRSRAKQRGLKLNEYGLFDGDALVRCASEKELFGALGLPYIPPELREDLGEFALSETPPLVEQSDLLGVFHCHTIYSDGLNKVEEMARGVRDRGYRYVALADHSQSARYAGGLSPERVLEQFREIDRVNGIMKDFRILKGIESDIRTDGSLDYDEELLRQFELIIVSVHNKLGMTESEATARVIKAIENPHTTILAHPTGRLLLGRQGYPLNLDKVFDACLANTVAVEINASPQRLDLDWRNVRKAKDKGVKLCIGPDAHTIGGLDKMGIGLGIARKGWLEPADLLNCMTAEEFLAWRKSR